MNITMRIRGALATACAVAAILAAGPLANAAYAGPDEPNVPDRLDVDHGHKPFLVGHAVGVQSYSCTIGPSGPRWTLDGPRADLYGDNGKVIATHFGGPTWLANDGSMVVGTRIDGVTVDPSAIPWLLLVATPSAGGDGDRLASTTFIQRINTAGGLEPPATDCTTSTVGTTEEVEYTADYVFWKSAGRSAPAAAAEAGHDG